MDITITVDVAVMLLASIVMGLALTVTIISRLITK